MIDKNNIPPHWEIKKLSEIITTLESGKRPKGGVQGILSGIPSIGAEHLNENGGFRFDKIKFVPPQFAASMKKGKLKVNDIIVVKDGATTGKTSIVRNGFPFSNAVINEHVFICRIQENILPKWVFLILWSEYGKQDILIDFRGAAQGGISSSFVEKVTIPLPTLHEQLQIVSKIEELFSELDKGQEQLETVKQQLKTYRQAVLKWAFEGRLTNKNVEKGKLPEGWRWVKFGDVVNEFVRGPFGSTLRKEFFIPEGFKIYEQQNAIYQSYNLGRYYISETKFREMKRFEVKPNDYIISCSGTIGCLFKIPKDAPKGIINQALLIIRINTKEINDKYFQYQFTSESFKKLIIKDAKGTAMLNLAGVKDMKEVPFILPPLQEQIRIIQEIESRLSTYDKMEETIENSLLQIESLRQSILKQAFEGKLV